MHIKKIGHCCLIIKVDNLTILTDPGDYTVNVNEVIGVDIVLITHEHADHLHIDSVREILKNNPAATIFTNSGVGKQLAAAGVAFTLLEGRATEDIKGVLIEAFDCKHEEIYEEMGQVQNTGYFIGNKLFYPGDSYFNPEKPVEILALPIGGPWCKLPDTIRYALAVKPKTAFPVHDGSVLKERRGVLHRISKQVFEKNGINLVVMNEGDDQEF